VQTLGKNSSDNPACPPSVR